MCGLLVVLSACSEKKADVGAPQNSTGTATSNGGHSGTSASPSSNQPVSGDVAVLETVKKQALPKFSKVTIGNAFEGYSYFKKREWKSIRTNANKYYIDFYGWFDAKIMDANSLKNGISQQGVSVKFVVNQDGSFGVVMVSRVEAKTDGSMYSYPLEDMKSILIKIYENKEIQF